MCCLCSAWISSSSSHPTTDTTRKLRRSNDGVEFSLLSGGQGALRRKRSTLESNRENLHQVPKQQGRIADCLLGNTHYTKFRWTTLFEPRRQGLCQQSTAT